MVRAIIHSAVFALVLVLSACESLPKQAHSVEEVAITEVILPDLVKKAATLELSRHQPEPKPPVIPLPPESLWDVVRQSLSMYEHNDHARVQKYRRQYLHHRQALYALLRRAQPYLYYFVEQTRERGLPIELALLPAVESSFYATAYSPQHAGGLWQIIPSTARQLKLRSNPWYDGRGDIKASTDAALGYLTYLHKRLNKDWLLALAAYNAGEYRVRRAKRNNVKRGRGKDFWALRLPRETRNYVPRLLALCSILADPQRYGIKLPELKNQPWFVQVPVDGGLSLRHLAKYSGIKEQDLKVLNPGLLRWITPPGKTTQLLIPVEKQTQFQQMLATLPPDPSQELVRYKVVRGDTLSGIAKRYGVSVRAITRANQRSSHRIRAGETLLIPSASQSLNRLALSQQRVIKHRVRSGDSLWAIAKRYKVSTRDLVRWNQLNPRRYLRPGQHLKVYVPS